MGIGILTAVLCIAFHTEGNNSVSSISLSICTEFYSTSMHCLKHRNYR